MESYYAGVYWLGRKEPAERCARRAERFFLSLSRCDPTLGTWFEKARTREEALKRPLAPTQATFEKMFLDKRYQTLDGFAVGGWTGHAEGSGGAASFFCGSSNQKVPANCLVQLPFEGADAERVLTAPSVSGVLRTMAQAWEPDSGVLMSNAYLRALGDAADADVLVGWVTYLSHRRGTVPPLPAPVRVEPVEDLGTLVILTPERFTASNPEHVALAARVHAVLDGAGLLRPLQPMDASASPI
ncbi:immunity 52 family protein [Pyxidicoccus sp. 3LG]